MKNAKANVMQNVFPWVNLDSIDVIIGKDDNLIAALVSLSRREAKVLHETVKSDKRFSEIAKACIFDSLPLALASSDSESISDSDSDHWLTLGCDKDIK